MSTTEIIEELLQSGSPAPENRELIEWADKIDNAATVDERISIIESMPPELAEKYVEMVHPS